MLAPAVAFYDFVLAAHIIGVLVAFGWTFALPLMHLLAGRHSPRSRPLLHRIEYVCSRALLNPALTLIVAAGVYMAADAHRWGEFFVQWGLGAALVIGAIGGSVMIPAAKRAEQEALEDIARAGEGEVVAGAAYLAAVRRLNITGALLWVLVLATIVIMAVKP